jgi:hypothetical protein
MRMALDNSRFEQMIADAMAAQQAGVFARTPVDSAALAAAPATQSRPVSLRERLLIGAPIAACLAAVLGLAALWGGGTSNSFTTGPLASLDPTQSRAGFQSSAGFDARTITDCLGGPGAAIADHCVAADFDEDGDVDLLDLSVYQRSAYQRSAVGH